MHDNSQDYNRIFERGGRHFFRASPTKITYLCLNYQLKVKLDLYEKMQTYMSHDSPAGRTNSKLGGMNNKFREIVP